MEDFHLEAITHGSFSTDKNKYYKRKNVTKENTLMFHFKNGDVYRTMTLSNINQTTINLTCSKKAKGLIQNPCKARMTLKLAHSIIKTMPKYPDQNKGRKKYIFSLANHFDDYLNTRCDPRVRDPLLSENSSENDFEIEHSADNNTTK